MRTLPVAFFQIFLVFFSVTRAEAEAAPYAPDRVLIRFKTAEVTNRLPDAGSNLFSRLINELDLPQEMELRKSSFSRRLEKAHAQNAARQKSPASLKRHLLMQLKGRMTPQECISHLKDHPLVDYVEPDYILSIGATYPSDPKHGDQWHFSGPVANPTPPGRVHAPEAWDITQGTSNIIVAVLDTGCDTNMAEFTGRITGGYDFINRDDDPSDDNGHGTAVAATVCANANNGTNGTGIDWQCSLMPVKVLDSFGNGPVSDIADGIEYATTSGAHIINMSASLDSFSSPLHTAVTNSTAKGVTFVTITGNETNNAINYPGRFPETIAVGANTLDGSRSTFSNYGTNIDLVAPGSSIEAPTTSGVWRLWTGTSMAGPQAAGTASLMLSIRPGLSNEEIRYLLNAGAVDQVSSDTYDLDGYDLHYGWGVLNAYNSLILADAYIREMKITNSTDISLSWECPPNANDKRPQLIETASSLTGTWTQHTNVVFNSANAAWADTNTTAETRYYRIATPPFEPE